MLLGLGTVSPPCPSLAPQPHFATAVGVLSPTGCLEREFWGPPLPNAAFLPEKQFFPAMWQMGQGGWPSKQLPLWIWGGGVGVYACTRFWGPSLTSRDWEKFTYTAHFHMSQLCLAEATICVVARRSGFFPAQRQRGFDLPRRCFVAARVVISLKYFFFPFSPLPHHLAGVIGLQPVSCLPLVPTAADGAEQNPPAPQISSIPRFSQTQLERAGNPCGKAKLSFK